MTDPDQNPDDGLKVVSVLLGGEHRHTRLAVDELGAVDAATAAVRHFVGTKDRRAALVREATMGLALDPRVACKVWQAAEDRKVEPRALIAEALAEWVERNAADLPLSRVRLDAEVEAAWLKAEAERAAAEAEIEARRRETAAFLAGEPVAVPVAP